MYFVAGNQCRCRIELFRYNIVNFHKKRSVLKEIPSEVEVSVVKMIVITRDDCITNCIRKSFYQSERFLFYRQHIEVLIKSYENDHISIKLI